MLCQATEPSYCADPYFSCDLKTTWKTPNNKWKLQFNGKLDNSIKYQEKNESSTQRT